MPLTATAKAIALDAAIKGVTPPSSATHVGLLKWSEAGKAGTAEADDNLITATSHGYSAGDLVIFAALTGGTGLVLLDPYFVIAAGLTANAFAVAKVPAGTAVDITVDASALTVRRLVELTGGSPAYARGAIAWASASAALEQIDDSTNGVTLNVPAGGAVDYQGGWSASTAGTLMWIDDVTSETYAGQGTYTASDVKINALT